jgi:hypothetical protein
VEKPVTVRSARISRLAAAAGGLACCLALGFESLASQGAPTLVERARGAERVVVGRVASSQPIWRVTEHGDRLIVTVLQVIGGETLKGAAASTLEVEVEGGTIGDLTLRVSDLPVLAPGDRAVFYLRRDARGALVPYGRGDGLLRLDQSNRVPGTSLTLDEVRRTVRAAAAAR